MHCENGPEKGVKSRIVHGFLWWVPVFYAEEGTCFWHSGGCIPPLPMCDRLVYFKFLRHLKYLSLSTQFWASIFLVSVFHGLNLCVSMFHASVFHYSVFRFSIFRASVFREPIFLNTARLLEKRRFMRRFPILYIYSLSLFSLFFSRSPPFLLLLSLSRLFVGKQISDVSARKAEEAAAVSRRHRIPRKKRKKCSDRGSEKGVGGESVFIQ